MVSSVAARKRSVGAELYYEDAWVGFEERALPAGIDDAPWVERFDESFELSEHPVVVAMRSSRRNGRENEAPLDLEYIDTTPHLSRIASAVFERDDADF